MKFSIITATYNVGSSLKPTLDSVLNQSYPQENIEMVIIDGGSTDGTVDIIKEYEPRFAGRLKWVSEKDSGIYNAFNKGVKMASGAVLNFKGAGDWLEADALSVVAENFAKEPEADMVVCPVNHWVRKGRGHKLSLINMSWKDPRHLPEHGDCLHQGCFYKADFHQKFGYYSENYRIAADLDLWLTAYLNGPLKYIIEGQPLVNFVLDGISSANIFISLFEREHIYQNLELKNLSRPERDFIAQRQQAFGIEARFLWDECLNAWLAASRSDKTLWAANFYDFIIKNSIDRMFLNRLIRCRFFRPGRFEAERSLFLMPFIDKIRKDMSPEEQIALFDSYFYGMHKKRHFHFKKLLKMILPYGLIRLYQVSKKR
jgi:glycosyltransferase involved in cell wall biosynthesis